MKRTLYNIAAILILTTGFALPALAQGAPPATPIDGGLSLLLAAGGIYGIKKLRDHRQKG